MKKLVLLIICGLCALSRLALSEGDFVVAAQNESLKLEVNESTLEMRITELSNGKIHETKAMEGKKGNGAIKNLQKSDLRVSYIVNAFVGTTNSMDSNSMSVAYQSYDINYIENGVEVRFTIGDQTITTDDLPKMVPVEKYYDKLLPYWSDRDDKAFREFYRIYQGTMWVRYNENAMGKVKLNNLYTLIYEQAEYTREDMEEDNAAYGYEIEKINPSIGVTVRYLIDDGDFIVSVPCGDISYTQGNQVTKIDLMPYFLSADTESEGYMLVPDGSGAIIRLNNGKTTAISYDDKVYGHDVLMNVESYVAPYESIRFPVYGIKNGDSAIFAIIESGAELASIYADISGRSDEFNRVYSYFVLRDIEQVGVVGNASGGSPRYPSDVYEGDITIRYKFLSGGDATYVGMARAYREYLLDEGKLVKQKPSSDAPFFAEIIGAVRKTEFAAGVPYESTAVATKTKQAETILASLTGAGVKTPILLLKGFYEGGVKHEALTKLDLESSVGSEKELLSLTQKAESAGGKTYLVSSLIKVYGTDGFSKSSQAARRQDDFIANVEIYAEPILSRTRGYTDSFYVSPAYLNEYLSKTAKKLDKAKLGVSGLALDDIGNLLVGDYRNKRNISRVHATPIIEEALTGFVSGRDVIISSPNDYALRFAGAVYDLPASDNGHKVEDEAVPFIQLTLDGVMAYCSKAWNESAYTGVWQELNYAIETKSCPHFILTFENEEIFLHTEDMDTQGYFMTEYTRWTDEISAIYAEFNDYWRKVSNSQIVSHEIIEKGLRKVVFDNGVTAYVNYNSSDKTADGIGIPARGFKVTEGGR